MLNAITNVIDRNTFGLARTTFKLKFQITKILFYSFKIKNKSPNSILNFTNQKALAQSPWKDSHPKIQFGTFCLNLTSKSWKPRLLLIQLTRKISKWIFWLDFIRKLSRDYLINSINLLLRFWPVVIDFESS